MTVLPKGDNVNSKVSVIVRTKNEERWIAQCLNAVFSQTYKNFEVIIVDNKSTDKTIEKAKQFPVKDFVAYADEKYFPGKALNMGIRKSGGQFVVCLSGHCIPNSNRWLENLIANFFAKEQCVAGVYGRQEPMPFTPDSDKRDLAIAFGLDRKVQKKDPFFHNANSAIRKDVWQEIPFDEKITNIEDRVWAKKVQESNQYKIVYEPQASVYHYHGIHQDGNEERLRNVVRILEDLHSDGGSNSIEAKKLNVVAIIPVKGEVQYISGKPLLEYTLRRALQARYIRKVIVSTDNPELAKIAKDLGADVPFMREKTLSEEHVNIDQVFQYSLNKLEELKIFPDLIVTLEITFPFRPKGLIDNMISHLTQKGFDSMVAAKAENRAIWKEREKSIVQLDEGLTPRKFKDSAFIEQRGIACVTHPEFLRKGNLLGDKIGIYELKDSYSHLEVRNEKDFELASSLIEKWFK